jgi:hypothetical protein
LGPARWDVCPSRRNDREALVCIDLLIPCPTDCTPAHTVPASRWHVAALADLSLVEDLLDWLEANGATERGVDILPDGQFAVWWRGSDPTP